VEEGEISIHPNVILMAILTPDGLSRKTYRAILGEHVSKDAIEGETDVTIAGEKFHTHVFEDGYDEGWQIAGNEGDIAVLDLVTYGYGEKIAWDELVKRKAELEEWARQVCEKYTCSFRIYVSANYW